MSVDKINTRIIELNIKAKELVGEPILDPRAGIELLTEWKKLRDGWKTMHLLMERSLNESLTLICEEGLGIKLDEVTDDALTTVKRIAEVEIAEVEIGRSERDEQQ